MPARARSVRVLLPVIAAAAALAGSPAASASAAPLASSNPPAARPLQVLSELTRTADGGQVFRVGGAYSAGAALLSAVPSSND